MIYAGWLGGYGNLTVIDHGGGVATAYGHQSSLAAGTGAYVAQGQVIGYVGSTGHSTGAAPPLRGARQRRPSGPARLPQLETGEVQVGQVSVPLVEVEAVADEELVGGREADVAHRQVVHDAAVGAVEQRHDRQRPR